MKFFITNNLTLNFVLATITLVVARNLAEMQRMAGCFQPNKVNKFALVAQSVEQSPFKGEVARSNRARRNFC